MSAIIRDYKVGEQYDDGVITAVHPCFIIVKGSNGRDKCINTHGTRPEDEEMRQRVEPERRREGIVGYKLNKDKMWDTCEENSLLHLKYVAGLSDKELGRRFGVTPKAISGKVARLKEDKERFEKITKGYNEGDC